MSADAWNHLSPDDLARLFGAERNDILQSCAPHLETHDWAYRRLTPVERDRMIVTALDKTDRDRDAATGEDRREAWQSGWSENLEAYTASGRLDDLVPRYIRPGETIRLLGDYAQPRNPDFVREYTRMYRAWLVDRYFADATEIYEYGCGPGSHTTYLAERLRVPVCGLDWVQASVDILNEVRRRNELPVRGRLFDFFNPDPDVVPGPGAVVLTFGALEQVERRFGAFLDHLLNARPLRCVHVEGFDELYDPASLLDALALRYHRCRGYLSGFLTELRTLQEAGRIVIETVHRQRFGTRFNDTFSLVVWRPL